MDPANVSPNATVRSHKNCHHEDPFPLISESQTPLTDISSSDSDPPTSTNCKSSSTSRARSKKARKAAHITKPTVPALRPAKDILSRIRHDPDLGGESEYMVGYLDRHEREPLEMVVTEWKGGVSDVTDEEFIPQHRILYFRKKGDVEGRKMWDRASRLDRVFGSGIVESGEVNDVNSRGEGATELQRKEREPSMLEEAAKDGRNIVHG